MNIVYIHQHFCTNKGSAGTRSYDVSRYLTKMGHKVTIITGILDISGLDRLPWYRLYKKFAMEGFDVIVCNVLYSSHQGFIARFWTYIWFAVLASFAVIFTRKTDVVFATHTPLTVGIPGYIGSRLKRVPFVFEVRDLWPESDIIAGNLKENSLLAKCLGWLEKFLYKKADKILLVSPGFEKRLLERGYPQRKLKTILLGADGDIFRELKPNKDFRRKYNLTNETIAVYTGVHGRANGLDYILDAAGFLKERKDIVIMLIGDGMEKPRLKKRVQEMGLDNVKFADYVPKSEIGGLLACCNIGLMILANVGERPVTPNKIFDYMFVGLPSIINFKGPTLEMVQSDQTGVFADPEKPQELAGKIVYFADYPDEAKNMGVRARSIAYKKYDRRYIAKQLVHVFEEMRNKI